MFTSLCNVVALVGASLAIAKLPAMAAATGDYKILAAGYSGQVTPLTFTPPSTFTAGKASKVNSTGKAPSWITFNDEIAYVTDESSPAAAYVISYRRGIEVLAGPAKTGGDGAVASSVAGDCLYVARGLGRLSVAALLAPGADSPYALAANYNSGSASVLEIQSKRLSGLKKVFQYQRSTAGPGPVTSRQDHSYAHDAVTSPSGAWVYIPDLGADRIHSLRTAKKCAKVKQGKATVVPDGSGPRHLAFFHSTAYLASELSCTLTAFKHNDDTGALVPIGAPLPVTPPGTPLGGNLTAGPQRTTAEVKVAPDGRWVYVSTRGDEVEDHVAIFKRRKDGSIRWHDWVPSGGLTPRHFSISHDGAWLSVGNQGTGNVVIFARGNDGTLTKTAELAAPSLKGVAFAGFAPAHHK